MSAPIVDQVLAELGAEVLTFSTLTRALQWYGRTHAGPAPLRAIPLDLGPGGSSSGARASRDATHAAISAALVGVQHAGLVVEWSEAWRSPESMAQDEGFPSVYALRATMRWTERLLAERLRDRGVLR